MGHGRLEPAGDLTARRSYSTHIPDFRLMTWMAETGRSAVHAANAWTKVVLLFIVVGMVTVTLDLYMVLLLLLATVVVYAAAGLPLRLLVGWWTLPLFFVVSLSIVFVFTEPGTVLASARLAEVRISVTDKGLELMATLIAKALAVVTYSLTVFMSTRYNDIAYIAYRIMPRTIANIFLLSYRFMFETYDEFSDVLDAIHSRSGSIARGVVKHSRAYAGIFGLAFVHAFERAEAISKAMEARGYSGSLPVSGAVPRPGPGGLLVVAGGILALAVAIYSRYIDGTILIWR